MVVLVVFGRGHAHAWSLVLFSRGPVVFIVGLGLLGRCSYTMASLCLVVFSSFSGLVLGVSSWSCKWKKQNCGILLNEEKNCTNILTE